MKFDSKVNNLNSFVKKNKIVLLFSIILKIFIISILIKYDNTQGDSVSYLNNAFNIFKYNIYSEDSINPSIYRPPLYSFFLAICMSLFGYQIFFFQIIQNIIFFISTFLLIKVIIKFDLSFSKFFFIFAILSPFETIYSGAILSESLTSFFIILTIYFLVCYSGYKKYILAGISLGLLCLTKDIFVLMPFILAFLFFILNDARKKTLFINSTLLIIFFLITIFPWVIRNNVISDKLLIISDGRLGYSLWIGTWAEDGKFTIKKNNSNIPNYPEKAFRNEEEKKFILEGFTNGIETIDKDFTKIAIERIKGDPINVLKTYIIRFPKLWLGTRTDPFSFNNNLLERGAKPWFVVKSFFYLINLIIVSSGLLGMVILLKKDFKKYFLITIPILYTSAIYLPLNSFENRYTQPLMLLMLFFSCVFFSKLFSKFKKF
jgi:4-amino-4-deoxy-L-arabinose transferase-like glycosyltransferase